MKRSMGKFQKGSGIVIALRSQYSNSVERSPVTGGLVDA